MRFALPAVLALALALPAAAAADTICVNMPNPAGAGCQATHTTFQAAMDDAATPQGVRDTIKLGPGLFETEPVFQIDAANNPVDVVGSGQGTDGTILRSKKPQPALRLTTKSTVTNLRVIVPGNLGDNASGLDIDEGEASNVTVVAEAGPKGGSGIYMRKGATVRNATVDMSAQSAPNYAISPDGAGAHLIEDSVLDATTLVNVSVYATNATVRRIRNTGRCVTCIYVRPGAPSRAVELSDSLLRLGQDGDAVTAQPGTTVNARNITLVGQPAANTYGFLAYGSGQVNVVDSIIRDVNLAIFTDGQGHVAIDYSDFDPDKVQKIGVTGLLTIGSHNVNEDPRFVNEAGGDYRLATGSPVADRASPGNGATEFDLARAPRLADANADGSAVLDMGAYEYVGQPYELPPVQNTPSNTGGGGGGGGNTPLGPAMTVGGKTVKLDAKRRVKVKLGCPFRETGTCTGTIRLVTTKKIRPRPGKKPVIVTVGTGAFKDVPVDSSRTVTITVKKSTAAILRRYKSTKLTATILAAWETGVSRTTTAALTLKPVRK